MPDAAQCGGASDQALLIGDYTCCSTALYNCCVEEHMYENDERAL
jgi:hypothetical protein